MNNIIRLIIILSIMSFQSCVKETKVSLEKQNILSEGNLTKDSIRNGFWEYKDKKGNFLAKGDYYDGLKKGKWEYKDLKYNSTFFIDWNIYKNSSFKLNLPSDWEIKDVKKSPVNTFFHYNNEKIYANGNITLIDARNKSIDSIIYEINKPYLEKENYELFLKKKILINKVNGYEINQSINVDNKAVFSKIFLLKREEEVFLLSFFCYKKDINLYNQLFTEIAYSFKG